MKHLLVILLFSLFSMGAMAQGRQAANASKIMNFYPNPASVVINFNYQRDYETGYSLLIFNFMGKKVYELKNTPDRFSINLDEFNRGVHIYQLRNRMGAVIESGKFQVVK
jgi:hypothetical protein